MMYKRNSQHVTILERIGWVLSFFCLPLVHFSSSRLALAGAETDQSTPDLTTTVEHRFARETNEVPDFRRHVMPLLARCGCSAASCHGTKNGQAGFQLSLFGYDWTTDHDELTLDGRPPRANWKSPLESVLLQKPTLQIDHGGGRRFDVDSWQYRLLLNWIQSNAPNVSWVQRSVVITRLDLQPKEILFPSANKQEQIRAVAHWSDGSIEDVTPLCRFYSKDDHVAEVTPAGLVRGIRTGDTHAIASYDLSIATLPIIVQHRVQQPTATTTSEPLTKIDRHIATKLRKLRITSSPQCSDEVFLRKVRLDLTGTLPTAGEVRQFLADDEPQKRSQKIDELLNCDEYATWWATWLCDLTGNNEGEILEPHLHHTLSRLWYEWIHKRIQDNVPYDEIVNGMVHAVSRRPGQNHYDYWHEMTSYVRREDPTDFSLRTNMPLFWGRTNLRSAENKALAFSYVFLGFKLQCAQCHKHPFDRWTKKDFDYLKQFFEDFRQGIPDHARDDAAKLKQKVIGAKNPRPNHAFAVAARRGETIPFNEVYYAPTRGRTTARSRDPMSYLVQWLRDPSHPHLSIALVNRVWHHYFGVGIVDPPDDLNLGNPPSNRPLLDHLAFGFLTSKYDIQWLHREILNSTAYQRKWQANDTNRSDRHNFSHGMLRRMPAEVLYDAVWMATAANQSNPWKESKPGRLVGVGSGMGRSDSRIRHMHRLGKPERKAVCDRERSNDPNLSQSLFLQNDPDIHKMLDRSDGWLVNLRGTFANTNAARISVENELIEEAYLRTLNRFPTTKEQRVCLEYLEDSPEVTVGMRGILWALLNSKEFCLIQ